MNMFSDFQMPKSVVIDNETQTDRFLKIIVEPFERGYGTTLGNSLRRVLLSSIPGAAITAIRHRGIFHEFSNIPGVLEDVSDIVLNLKEVRVKSHQNDPIWVHLKASGPGRVTAGQIETQGVIEILDPDHLIATLDKGATLDLDLQISVGRGYIPADRSKEDNIEVGVIPIDAIYTPIKRVNFYVDSTRVGRMTDYDRLTMEVETDGSLTPEEAIAQASLLLKDHLNLFSFEEPAISNAGISTQALKIDQVSTDLLGKPVTDLDLSLRALSCLKNAHISTIGELIQKSEHELLDTKIFGRKSISEVRDALGSLGLSLGLDLQNT
jgi:DNA-directed RNA polymerase subunit alpha